VSVAVAGVALVEPCAVVTPPAGIVLTCGPTVVPVTETLTVQLAPAPTAPPASAKLDAPAAAVTLPPHVVDAFGVAEISFRPEARR